jgi:glutathione S-transferase
MHPHDNVSSGSGYKVRHFLTQVGIRFERIEYDIDEGETRTPEFFEKLKSQRPYPGARNRVR